MKNYLKRNFPPLLAELAFLACCFLLPSEQILYANTLFYLFVFLYFLFRKDFSFQALLNSWKSGKRFWMQTALTALGFIAAFILSLILENAFPQLDAGMISLKVSGWPGFFCFLLSTLLLPPLAEELFFRQSMISFESKPLIVCTALLGMFFYALEHALTPWGVLLCMIWALPLAISYIRTKNIYVPITAHFLINLIGNGPDIISLLTELLSKG